MLGLNRKLIIETERMSLRLPVQSDFKSWAMLREESVEFLEPWEPSWSIDHLSRKNFNNRVYWSQKAAGDGTALPVFMILRSTGKILGAITLDNIRRGPAQVGTLGYWIGKSYSRNGFMREAIDAVVYYAFNSIDLSRVEAACLPDNLASRSVLEKSGFKYEGVAQSYLQINGRWRNHVLYACLRSDRRGKTLVGKE
jgi:ribosomal-protein-alanine N-acetyltransferase